MNKLGLSINTIEIPVSDLKLSVKWYVTMLGMVCHWSDDHHAVMSIDTDEELHNNLAPKLLLVETNDNKQLGFICTYTNISHSVLDLHTENLFSTYTHIKTLLPSLAPIEPPANDWAPQGFNILDPDGNRIAIFSYNKTQVTDIGGLAT